MSKEVVRRLAELRAELKEVENNIEMAADQGDHPTVEHYVEQERYLKAAIKLHENHLS